MRSPSSRQISLLHILLLSLPELSRGQPAELYPSIDPHHYGAGMLLKKNYFLFNFVFSDGNPCYDRETRAPQRCVPDFINAAFNLEVRNLDDYLG